MPIATYRCQTCEAETERVEITTGDKAAPPPVCGGDQIFLDERTVRPMELMHHELSAMVRCCGSCSFTDVTMRGEWVRFSSNRPVPAKNRGARSI